MKKLSHRFILSNIITSVWLALNTAMLRGENELIWKGRDLFYGIIIYLIFLFGVYFSFVKARDLAYRCYRKPSGFESFVLVLLYLFAILGNSGMLYFSGSLIFGGMDNAPEAFKNISTGLMVISFFYIVAEGYVLGGNSNPKPVSDRKRKIADYAVMLYISTGITITWNALILGGKVRLSVHQHDFVSELIAACVLVVMMVLPFQRLFWYEVFADSGGWKDNLKVAASFLLVIAGAILPLFF